MNNNDFNVSNKKSAGKGNGNTVINNHENESNNRSDSPTSSNQTPDLNTYSKTKKNQ